jgi:ankyrin repeat protein
MKSDLHLNPLAREVIEAIDHNDPDRIKDVLNRNLSIANPKWRSDYKPPNATDATNWLNEPMLLFYVSEAVFEGKIPAGTNEYAITKALLAAGADVDFFDGYPLVAAVSYNAPHVVRALLENGASVNGTDNDGVPMAYTLFFGFTTASMLLVEWGAKIDLRFAAGIGDLDKVKSFFKADGSLKPGAGALADPYGHEWKQRNGVVHRCDRTRENILSQALLYACLHDRLVVAEYLIQQGAHVNALVPDLGEKEFTVLHRVANTGNFGATADPRDVESQRLGAVNFLLEHGADVAIRDPVFKATPPQWAKHFGCESIAEILQKHGET